MQQEYGFNAVNGNRSICSVAGEITARVEGLMGI